MLQRTAKSTRNGFFSGTALLVLLVIISAPVLPASAAAQTAGERPQMVLVTESAKSFPETVRSFKNELSAAGWSLLNVTNMAGVLSERGFTLRPVVIMDVCSGKYSAGILERDDYRPISAFMPCRVSIYMTSDGRVFISRMNTGAFAAMMDPGMAAIMTASSDEIEAVIARTVR